MIFDAYVRVRKVNCRWEFFFCKIRQNSFSKSCLSMQSVDKCLKVIQNIDVQEKVYNLKINDSCSGIGIVHLFH